MPENLNILFVEDLITDFELALYEIRKARQDFSSIRVDTHEDYVDALRLFKPDIIISDYIMPLFNGMTALVIKQDISPDVPFIMLTGSTNEETAVECMKAGADDYVIKEHIKRLPLSIAGALANAAVKKEIKRAQQELSRRELLLRNAVNNLPSTFTVYDAQGKIEYINKYGLSLANLTAKEAIGKREEDIFPPEITDSYLPLLYSTFTTRETQVSECLINYADFARYVIFYFVPSLDESNNIYKVLGIAYDITERKNAEEKLKIAIKKAEESDRIKSTFLANISHEIRTPLNAIMGFSQMISRTYNNDEQLTGFVDIIMLSCSQLLDIIKEMIEVSQLVSGVSNTNNSVFSLNDLMNELYNSFRSKEITEINPEIKLILEMHEMPEKEVYLMSDREKLNRILRNLLSNAFKFTNKGLISFGCKKTDSNFLHFYIRDTGIGIEEDKLELIFDTFRQVDESYTRHYGGVGLGLTICRELVNLLGGKIWVESEPGIGSVFNFTLPILNEQE
jgi:PAS domain S-box-containing protein